MRRVKALFLATIKKMKTRKQNKLQITSETVISYDSIKSARSIDMTRIGEGILINL
jgi:hypothetical protein